jgi:hypothetical protein
MVKFDEMGGLVGEMGGQVQRWVAKLVDMGGKVAIWLAKLRGGWLSWLRLVAEQA